MFSLSKLHMEFIESNLLLINCYCEYDGCETHKKNWFTPVHDVINNQCTFLYKQLWCKLLAFSSLIVMPVYFLSTGSFRKGGYFSYLLSLLLKCLVHICRDKGRLAFASHAQWEAWRVWVGLEGCSHRHGISRGSVCQECCEHQTTTGNGTRSSLQLCGV